MDESVRVVLDGNGVRELLKSSELKEICEKHALEIKKRCGKGYQSDVYTGKNRVNAMVFASTQEAVKDNMNNNTILKAVMG